MKKKILSGLFALAFLATAGYGVDKSMKSETDLSDLALANVEALANNEDGGSSNNWDCWSQEKSGSGYWRCGNPCAFIDGKGGKGATSKCYAS